MRLDSAIKQYLSEDWLHTMLVYDIDYPIQALKILTQHNKNDVLENINDIHMQKRYDFASDGNSNSHTSHSITNFIFLKKGKITNYVNLKDGYEKNIKYKKAVSELSKHTSKLELFYLKASEKESEKEMNLLQRDVLKIMKKYPEIFKIVKI